MGTEGLDMSGVFIHRIIRYVKAFTALTVATIFLAGAICAAVCPELFIRQTHCQSGETEGDNSTKATADKCLRADLSLLQKSFADGFVLAVFSIAIPLPEPAVITPVVHLSVPPLVNLRPLVLRI